MISIFIQMIDTIAGFVAGTFLLRFWMQAVRVRPPAPVSQFVYQLSDWLVKPMRKVLPGVGGYDWSSLAGALLIVLADVAVDCLIVGGISALSPTVLSVVSVLRLMKWAIYGLTGLLILEVIFSWINPYAPLAPFVRALNDPLLIPLRRIVPPLGGLDLTPMVALLLFQIMLFMLNQIAAQVGSVLSP